MRTSNFLSIKDSIIQCFKNDSIEHIIIDVRGNYGGNDKTWENLVALLIGPCGKKEISCAKNNDIVKDYLEYFLNEDSIDFNYNKSKSFLNDDFCYFTIYRMVQKVDTSLDYKGDFYIFYDNKVFSSTNCFIQFMKSFDNVKFIGKRGGYMRYVGYKPVTFMLPNSKLLITTPINFNITDIKNINDFYPMPEFEVDPSVNYFYKYATTPDTDYYKYDNLILTDEYFLKFLTLINEN